MDGVDDIRIGGYAGKAGVILFCVSGMSERERASVRERDELTLVHVSLSVALITPTPGYSAVVLS
jgi:hypothetical protein